MTVPAKGQRRMVRKLAMNVKRVGINEIACGDL